MKKPILLILSLLAWCGIQAQEIAIDKAKFHLGDDMAWSNPAFDDSSWQTISVTKVWDEQDIRNENGYAWYRINVVIPSSLKTAGDFSDMLVLSLAKIDDVDETYLNGQLVGKTGSFPNSPDGYSSTWDTPRRYVLNVANCPVKWDKMNTIAVRVYNQGNPGGIFGDKVYIRKGTIADFADINISQVKVVKKGKSKKTPSDALQVDLVNKGFSSRSGELTLQMIDIQTGEPTSQTSKKVTVGKKPVTLTVPFSTNEVSRCVAVFTDETTGKSISKSFAPKYILTPPEPENPRYNGPLVYGVRPKSPIIFRMPFSGKRPMTYRVENLPAGLKVDAERGVISGSLENIGTYELTLVAENEKGTARQKFSIKVGNKIALTPPMGWNSWNCWGLSVSQEKVISSAQAIIDKGLADYGYSYINIDDAWEAAERNADGTIATNEKFPDMKGLGEWLHQNGLKFGIYSSPGDRTCGNYLGSIDHEEQDAKTYNDWGIDYLKYDWCGYNKVFTSHNDRSTAAYVRPYLKMEQYLREQPRDIFYSLCQYGMSEVWKWGHAVDANSWRTTGDITDTWESLYDIGFVRQAELYPYAAPGHWNDPDMLIVGKVGWSNNLRDSRLTPDEQYTHISLWSLLAANMLIGCDVSQMDDFTRALLCNNEVNAVHQDVLGTQARPVVVDGDIQLWMRPLADGTHALGIFNVGEQCTNVDLAKYLDRLGLKNLTQVRDLWRQKDLSVSNLNYFVPNHGVKYLKVK